MGKMLEKIRAGLTFFGQVLIWRALRCLARNAAGESPLLMLLPCEPGSVIGSRGDEAMIYAILGDFRRRHPDGKIMVSIQYSIISIQLLSFSASRIKRRIPDTMLTAFLR